MIFNSAPSTALRTCLSTLSVIISLHRFNSSYFAKKKTIPCRYSIENVASLSVSLFSHCVLTAAPNNQEENQNMAQCSSSAPHYSMHGDSAEPSPVSPAPQRLTRHMTTSLPQPHSGHADVHDSIAAALPLGAVAEKDRVGDKGKLLPPPPQGESQAGTIPSQAALPPMKTTTTTTTTADAKALSAEVTALAIFTSSPPRRARYAKIDRDILSAQEREGRLQLRRLEQDILIQYIFPHYQLLSLQLCQHQLFSAPRQTAGREQLSPSPVKVARQDRGSWSPCKMAQGGLPLFCMKATLQTASPNDAAEQASDGGVCSLPLSVSPMLPLTRHRSQFHSVAGEEDATQCIGEEPPPQWCSGLHGCHPHCRSNCSDCDNPAAGALFPLRTRRIQSSETLTPSFISLPSASGVSGVRRSLLSLSKPFDVPSGTLASGQPLTSILKASGNFSPTSIHRGDSGRRHDYNSKEEEEEEEEEVPEEEDPFSPFHHCMQQFYRSRLAPLPPLQSQRQVTVLPSVIHRRPQCDSSLQSASFASPTTAAAYQPSLLGATLHLSDAAEDGPRQGDTKSNATQHDGEDGSRDEQDLPAELPLSRSNQPPKRRNTAAAHCPDAAFPRRCETPPLTHQSVSLPQRGAERAEGASCQEADMQLIVCPSFLLPETIGERSHHSSTASHPFSISNHSRDTQYTSQSSISSSCSCNRATGIVCRMHQHLSFTQPLLQSDAAQLETGWRRWVGSMSALMAEEAVLRATLRAAEHSEWTLQVAPRIYPF